MDTTLPYNQKGVVVTGAGGSGLASTTSGQPTQPTLQEQLAALKAKEIPGLMSMANQAPAPIVPPSTPTTIAATDINNTSKVTIPTPTNINTNVLASSLTNQAVAGASAYDRLQKEAEAKLAAASTEKSNTKSTMDSLMEQLGLKGQTQANLEQTMGRDTAQSKLNQINNEILKTSEGYRMQYQDLANLGVTDAQRRDTMRELQRQEGFALANLNIEKLIAQGDLSLIDEQVKRKIDLQFSDLQSKFDYQKMLYDDLKGDMSKAEERQWQTMMASTKNEIDTGKEQAKQISDLFVEAAKNGAPSSVAQAIANASTIQDAQRLAAPYVGLLDRQKQQIDLMKIQQDLVSSNNAPVTLSGKPQNASQAAANGYADRLNEANVTIDNIGSKFTGALAYGGYLPNALQSSDRQAFEQAKRNFVTAVLRRESGAAISASEFETEDLKYFPQPGDTADTVIQKAKARNTAINNVYREANVPRPVLPGQIIESGGVKYRVASDGVTLEKL